MAADRVLSKPLGGLRAVVTGASSGIGRSVAVELARLGASLHVHACRNATGLADVQQQLGPGTTASLADFTDAQTCEAFVEEVWAHQAVDIWVHCAGADVLTGEAAELSFDAKLSRLWQTDVLGTVACCRDIGQRMQRAGSGVILTIGWDQAETGMEGDSGQMFGMTKAAIAAFTKALAKTLAPTVRVNCLAPGWIKTKWGNEAPNYWNERAIAESLVGRWGTPDDVANAVAFLAAPQASFITGQVLPINGGFAGRACPNGS